MKIQKDKVKHFTVSALLVVLFAVLQHMFLPSTFTTNGPIITGAILSAFIGGSWEIIRLKRKGITIEPGDLVANAIGIAIGCGVAAVILPLIPFQVLGSMLFWGVVDAIDYYLL